MKLMRGNRNRWSVAFTLVFSVQLLVSALCVIPSAQAAVVAEVTHCNEAMQHEMSAKSMQEMAMQAQPESSPMATCSHCSSPENFALFLNNLDISPSDLLLAFVVVETAATTSQNFIARAQAPPRSSTTLYTTTQRIRI
ncbi:MAG: hypothetical protein ABUK11_07900 [Mariprofundaceae bacterium]